MVPDGLVEVAHAIVEFHVPGIYVSVPGRRMPTRTPSMDSSPSSTPSKPLTFALFGLLCFRRGHLFFPEELCGSAFGRCILDCLYIGSSFQLRTKLFAKVCKSRFATVKTSWRFFITPVTRLPTCTPFSVSLMSLPFFAFFGGRASSWLGRRFICKEFLGSLCGRCFQGISLQLHCTTQFLKAVSEKRFFAVWVKFIHMLILNRCATWWACAQGCLLLSVLQVRRFCLPS